MGPSVLGQGLRRLREWVMQVGAWSLTRQILHYRRQLACGAAGFRDIRQGHGKHLESRGELGIVRYLIFYVFVQFLLLSEIACARDMYRLLAHAEDARFVHEHR